jgi:hypothetical protein
MSEPTATEAELALAVEACPNCGAPAGTSCPAHMAQGSERTEAERAELRELARAPLLMHPERLAAARERIESAIAYGLVERVPAKGRR